MVITKTIADTDSIHCLKPTSSNQSSVFIGYANNPDWELFWGKGFDSSTVPKLKIFKHNLARNVIAHFFENKDWYLRASGQIVALDKNWLISRLETLDAFFANDSTTIQAGLNRETSSNPRLYLKGLHALKNTDNSVRLDLREYLFSGDEVVFKCEGAEVSFEINSSANVPQDLIAAFCYNESAASRTAGLLRVGDHIAGKDDGEFTVIEVLSKAYRICADKTNKIRTVPKAVVSAWYKFYVEHETLDYDVKKSNGAIEHKTNVPIRDASTRAVRDIINGSTEDDKYEHGYDGMLGAIARWLLDNPRTVVDEEPEKPKEPELPPNVDRLTIALKLFKEMRTKLEQEGGWLEDGVKVNALQREYFATLTPEVLRTWGIPEITNFFISRPNGGRYGWMWSGTNGAGWNQIKNGLDEGSAPQIAEFLARVAKSSQFAVDFCKKGYEKPDGFGSGVISELLMKFYPSEYIKHGFVSHAVLKDLGLISFLHRADYTEGQYKQVLGVSSMLLDRMCEMKLPRAINQDGTEDTAKPDYLTVNEFIWFVNEKKDLLKEEVLKMSEKKIEKKPRTGERKIEDAANDPLMQRLMAALRTKPFAILAGHSGTGKSRMVRRLAYMTCNDEGLLKEAEKSNAPGNYCMVQVKPNWHDSTDLIGYFSELDGGAYHTTPFVEFVAKAYAYPETPFFVCLDEMNLAPVEHYFAEYLSAIESRDAKTGLTDALIPNTYDAEDIMPHELIADSVKEFKAHGLTIPKNLFVVGTVNMDETTHQFSRKVLDRAMTVLMDEVDFNTMSSGVEPSDEQLLDLDGIKFFLDAAENVKFDDAALLTKLNVELANTPFVVAYRFAKEFALYKEAIAKLDEKATATTALDHMVLMKLLPRIHGEKELVRHIFEGKDGKTGIKSVVGEGLSKAQMDSILARSDEYLTFWP